MYSDYKGSSSYLDGYHIQDDYKRATNSTFESTYPPDNGGNYKASPWKIEESK